MIDLMTECERCGKHVTEVGRLHRITWQGHRAYLCSDCREEIKIKSKIEKHSRTHLTKQPTTSP